MAENDIATIVKNNLKVKIIFYACPRISLLFLHLLRLNLLFKCFFFLAVYPPCPESGHADIRTTGLANS